MEVAGGCIAQREQNLKERTVAEAALWTKMLHELFEGHLFVGIGRERCFLDSCKQFSEGGIAGQLSSQYECIGKESNNIFEFGAISVGGWRADDDILLTGIALDQRLESCKHRHEEGDILLLTECLNTPRQREWQGEVEGRSAEGLNSRPAVVGWQFGGGRQILQLSFPESKLTVEVLTAQMLLLPHREVCILNRQLCELCGLSRKEALIENPQLTN